MLHFWDKREYSMLTAKPMIKVNFSKSDIEIMQIICKRKKISKSLLIRKVIKGWLEEYEDELLARRAEKAEEKWEKRGRKTVNT